MSPLDTDYDRFKNAMLPILIMVDDAILSREAAYIYQYAIGFSPVSGNLHKWSGIVEDSTGQAAELQVEIPEGFPQNPPKLTLAGTTQHGRLDAKGEIRTRSIQHWNPGNHVYQVIREAKSGISKGKFQSISAPQTSDQETTLKSQIANLNSQLEMKKQEFSNLQQQSVHEVARTQDVGELIEDSLIEVENEAYALEESYDNLELKAIDFAKQFVDARKRYYLIESSKN